VKQPLDIEEIVAQAVHLALNDSRLKVAFGDIRNRTIWTACFRDQNGRQRRISTKEANNKRALKIAEEFGRAAKTKRTLKQVQNVLDRLHEEISGQRVVRTTFREYLSDWLMAKKAETASSTMDFYQTSLRKFVQFLGQRADEPSTCRTDRNLASSTHKTCPFTACCLAATLNGVRIVEACRAKTLRSQNSQTRSVALRL
jgi:hypothetical protein